MKVFNSFGFIPILILVIVIGEYSTHAHLHRFVNGIGDEFRNSLRDIYRSLHRGHKPRWYHEHHRPEPVLRPFDRTTAPSTTRRTTTRTTTTPRSVIADRRRPNIPAFPNRDVINTRRVGNSDFCKFFLLLIFIVLLVNFGIYLFILIFL